MSAHHVDYGQSPVSQPKRPVGCPPIALVIGSAMAQHVRHRPQALLRCVSPDACNSAHVKSIMPVLCRAGPVPDRPRHGGEHAPYLTLSHRSLTVAARIEDAETRDHLSTTLVDCTPFVLGLRLKPGSRHSMLLNKQAAPIQRFRYRSMISSKKAAVRSAHCSIVKFRSKCSRPLAENVRRNASSLAISTMRSAMAW